MAPGRGRDSGLPPVRDDRRGVVGGELRDPPDLRESAAAVDIRLQDVHPGLRQPLVALEARGGELGTAHPRLDALGEPCVALQVVVLERGLGEVDVAILDAAKRPERGAPVAPAVAEIEHERDVVPEHAPSLADGGDELGVGHEVVEKALHLHRAEAAFQGGIEATADVAHQFRERAALRQAGEDRGVGRECLLAGSAEELVHGPAELLADEVVERDVDRRERVDAEPASTWVEGRAVQLVGEGGDWKWVAADDEVADVPAPDVEIGLLDERAHEVGRGVRLADARPALLIREPDNDSIGGAVAVARVHGRRDDGDDLQAGDRRAHGASLRSRRGRAEHIGTQTANAWPSNRYGWLRSVNWTFVQPVALPRRLCSGQHDPEFPRLQCMWSARDRAQAEPAGATSIGKDRTA